jgi:ribosomal protein L37AE/L43A
VHSYDTPTITECDYGITPPPSVVRRRHAVAKPSPPDTKEIKQRKIEPVDSHMNYVEHTLFAYQCDVCERGFEDVRRLDYHKNTVHTARVWTCDPCQKSFKTRKHLAQHERTQTCMQHRSEMQMIEH